MSQVELEQGEPIEKALRRFRKGANMCGHLRILRNRRTFENSHDKKIRKTKEAAMRALRMFIKFLLVLAIVMIGAMFSMENNQLVNVDFILLQSATMSLGLWLIIFLAIGCLLGLLASSLLITYYRRQLTRAMKKD